MNDKKIDSVLSLISLVLAVLSIVNFEKTLLIMCLIIGLLIFGYSIFKIIKKEPKIPMLVFSFVSIINTILWIIFIYGLYDKMVS